MDGIIGFVICCITGGILIGVGIFALFAKKPVHFWAGDRCAEVSDIQGYNRVMAKFYFVLGAVLILLCTPLLIDEIWGLFSVIGVAIEFIVAAAVYAVKIEGKYKR